MRAAGSSMNAPGCSLREMGSRPERRMGHPASEMAHPGWRTCVHERTVEHDAPLMGHPERRSSHPEALMEHPGRNGEAVFRGESVLPGRKAVPGGKMGRFGRENVIIAGVGCDGPDWSTAPARCVSPTFRTAEHPRPFLSVRGFHANVDHDSFHTRRLDSGL
jgi:hypothetical protein